MQNNKLKPWYVYLIRTRYNSLYCGVTTNVARRFKEHTGSKLGAKALKGKGPLTLEWSSNAMEKTKAFQLEYKIKQLPKSKKELLIKNTP